MVNSLMGFSFWLLSSQTPILSPVSYLSLKKGSSWTPKEKTYETDLAVLQWVEELEQLVILSDLQIRYPGLALGRGLLRRGC